MKESIILPPDARESGIKVRPPQGCEIDEIKVVDGFLTVTFKEKERKLPKSWEEFCEMFPIENGESYINEISAIIERDDNGVRLSDCDKSCLPNRATADAVLALCQLIQLRNAYNGDWVPNWKDQYEQKYTIEIEKCTLLEFQRQTCCSTILYFKTKDLRDEFLRDFRTLIEKLKPIYGIKEGGEE